MCGTRKESCAARKEGVRHTAQEPQAPTARCQRLLAPSLCLALEPQIFTAASTPTCGTYIPCMKRTARFSSTMPSLPAKKANTYFMKCCSAAADGSGIDRETRAAQQVHKASQLLDLVLLAWSEVRLPCFSSCWLQLQCSDTRANTPVSFCQSRMSLDKSTSSTVQKLATCCLYIVHMSR